MTEYPNKLIQFNGVKRLYNFKQVIMIESYRWKFSQHIESMFVVSIEEGNYIHAYLCSKIIPDHDGNMMMQGGKLRHPHAHNESYYGPLVDEMVQA